MRRLLRAAAHSGRDHHRGQHPQPEGILQRPTAADEHVGALHAVRREGEPRVPGRRSQQHAARWTAWPRSTRSVPPTATCPGQKEREFIVRGDEIGRRPIRVNFGGFITGPGIDEDAPVPFNGSARHRSRGEGSAGLPGARVPSGSRRGLRSLRAARRDHQQRRRARRSTRASISTSAPTPISSSASRPRLPRRCPSCEPIDGPVVRQLQHLYPGDRVTRIVHGVAVRDRRHHVVHRGLVAEPPAPGARRLDRLPHRQAAERARRVRRHSRR